MDEHLYDVVKRKSEKWQERVEGVINTEKCYVRKTGINFC